jgi:hypothetical protein
MNRNNWPRIILVSNLVIISSVVILFLNHSYPMVGLDYRYSVLQILDNLIFIKKNGLTIQWYSPSFGGGIPAFPDPNNSQFSLLEMVGLLVQPWRAIMLTTVGFIILGGGVSFYFFNKVMKLHWTASVLGTIFFTATGFYMERIACGHIFYQTFLLFTVLLVSLLDSTIPRVSASIIFSSVIAIMIYEASFFLIFCFGLSLLVTLPLIYIYRPQTLAWKHFFQVIFLGGLIAFLLSVAKLSAVYSFMRFFPRQLADDYSSTNFFKGLLGIGLQLLGTMNLIPFLSLARIDQKILPIFFKWITGANYGYWEFDMSLSPIAIGILFLGGASVVRRQGNLKKLFKSKEKK